jgi:hypothetical protein
MAGQLGGGVKMRPGITEKRDPTCFGHFGMVIINLTDD